MEVVWSSKKRFVQSLVALLVGSVTALWITHYVTQRTQYEELSSYANYTLDYATRVTLDLKRAVEHAQASSYSPCSEADLALLRDLLWQHKYLKDVGRVEGDKLLCSAERGMLSSSVALPEATAWLGEDTRFWSGAHNFVGIAFQTDMVANGNVLVLTSPFAFDAMRQPPSDMSAVILSRGTQYIFRTFGRAPEILEHDSRFSWLPIPSSELNYYSCSGPELCVFAEDRKVGVYGLSAVTLLGIVMLGGLSGIGLISFCYKTRQHRESMLYHLKRAIQEESLTLVYQPKIQISNQKVVGAEALVRWHSEQFGSVSPEIFIGIAETNGLIRAITHQVINNSFAEMQALLSDNPSFKLSINLSIQDLMDDSLLGFVKDRAKYYGINMNQLVFEITERSAGDHKQLAQTVRQYTDEATCISLDDFGTGYSNLAWLGHLNAGEIKVDKSFTQSIGTGSINQTMLEAIFSLLQGLNVEQVFEGVETHEQAAYILEHCPHALVQGWLYSKPLVIEEFEQYLKLNS